MRAGPCGKPPRASAAPCEVCEAAQILRMRTSAPVSQLGRVRSPYVQEPPRMSRRLAALMVFAAALAAQGDGGAGQPPAPGGQQDKPGDPPPPAPVPPVPPGQPNGKADPPKDPVKEQQFQDQKAL